MPVEATNEIEAKNVAVCMKHFLFAAQLLSNGCHGLQQISESLYCDYLLVVSHHVSKPVMQKPAFKAVRVQEMQLEIKYQASRLMSKNTCALLFLGNRAS